MGIAYSSNPVHWNYFLTLQEDFARLSRFVEPCEQNNGAFSIEFARLLMAATQEVDVVMKLLCKCLDPACKARSVNGYHTTIQEHLPEIKRARVAISRYGMESSPLINWADNNPPQWWTANNKIKHQRDTHFEHANLKNTFNAMAALLITVGFYYQQLRKSLGKPHDWNSVSQYLDLTSQPMLFDLQEPALKRVIDGGFIGAQLESNDLAEG